jgi:hypothetical protein
MSHFLGGPFLKTYKIKSYHFSETFLFFSTLFVAIALISILAHSNRDLKK